MLSEVKAKTLEALKKAGVAIVNPEKVPVNVAPKNVGPRVTRDNVKSSKVPSKGKVRKAMAAAEKVPENEPEISNLVDSYFGEFDLKELGDFAPTVDKYQE